MGNSTGGLIGAALILGLSIVIGSFMVKSSLDRGSHGLKEAVAELKTAVEEAAVADARPSQPARRGKPDPERRYKVNVDGEPAKGPETAKVTIVEFSDFQ